MCRTGLTGRFISTASEWLRATHSEGKVKQRNVAYIIRALESADGGPIPYTKTRDEELVVGHLALSRKPFGYERSDGKWCVYFRTKLEIAGFWDNCRSGGSFR